MRRCAATRPDLYEAGCLACGRVTPSLRRSATEEIRPGTLGRLGVSWLPQRGPDVDRAGPGCAAGTSPRTDAARDPAKPARKSAPVGCRLLGDAGQRGAFLLGFDDADSLAVHQQQIVARPGLQRHLAQRDATAG